MGIANRFPSVPPEARFQQRRFDADQIALSVDEAPPNCRADGGIV